MIDLKIPIPKRRRAKEKAARPRERRPVNRDNLKAGLWLWCFPVGLALVWRPRCTWPKGVKIAVTALMAAVVAAVFLFPTPDRVTEGGVELVSDSPNVEVYGPELPAFIVPGYVNEQTDSIIVPPVESSQHYVYAADGAECYHEYNCKFAFASSQRLTVYEAYYLGFRPCGRCKPPIYDPATGLTHEQVTKEN